MPQTLPEVRYFNTGEVAINYARWEGEKPAFLFIHGITDRHETWYDVSDEIRRGSSAVAVDLRGHGRSGHVPKPYVFIDYARDMAALLDELDLAPVVIVGHSLGGLTAIQLAATRPELVHAIVLEDPPLYGREIMQNHHPEWRAQFDRSAEIAGSRQSIEGMAALIRSDNPDVPEEFVERRSQHLFATDSSVISGAMTQLTDESLDWLNEIESKMRRVECPTLLLQGNMELGGWMQPGDGVRAKKLIPDCKLETWEDAGHSLHREHPERFIEQVNGFVSGLASAGRSS